MSFYRNLVATVAAMGLATTVFADTTTSASSNAAQSPTAQAAAPQQAAPVQTAENTSATTNGATDATSQEKVDLNKASVKQLMAVKGMTKSKAVAIVAYRKKHGDFKSLDDLKQVRGFKKMDDSSMKGMEDQLTVG